MSPGSVGDRNSRPKRNKTELACDTCRKRKSRCDGRRPSCSHCDNMGLDCIYRPPLTSLETDASVLTRLSNIETRLYALDQGRTDLSLASTPAQEPLVIKTWPQAPKFHHAAAHKMFNYWANLRTKLEDIPGLEPLTYVCRVDDNDTGLFSASFESPVLAEIPISVVVRGIESLFASMEGLPFIFRHLFLYGGLSKEVCLDVFRRYLEVPPGHDIIPTFKSQPIEQLVVQAIALKHMAVVAGERMLGDHADLSFRQALQQMWVVQTLQNPRALPFRFLLVIMLLYLYGRPYHALSILQTLEPLVYHTAPKENDDPAVKAQYEACLYQYFILESDILSEVDGVPSERLHTVIVAALTQNRAVAHPNVFGNELVAAPVDNHQSQEIRAHLQLRAYMNTILEHMYNVDRAYCRPSQVAAVVTDIARRLDLWYWTLPLNMRFPRHPSSFCLAPSDMWHIMVSEDPSLQCKLLTLPG
ncbi:Fungal Zn2-Cys6 binuclear cluster domain-containing protein isoform 2 [Cladophialophora immunda]|nr:Fungal Zn2-Cys6 binuclear cluster domain-containing protein isoform 2 [Cladophialophora immunda]